MQTYIPLLGFEFAPFHVTLDGRWVMAEPALKLVVLGRCHCGASDWFVIWSRDDINEKRTLMDKVEGKCVFNTLPQNRDSQLFLLVTTFLAVGAAAFRESKRVPDIEFG